MPGPALRAQPPLDPEPPVATTDDLATWIGPAWDAAGPTDRHSRRVALLKRLLPAIGVGLLLLIAMWPRLAPLWERMRFAVPAIDLRDARELKMIHPRYAGIDHRGLPYLVTAASGRQLPDRQDLMSLRGPRADIKTHGGAAVTISARTGVYQSQTQLLDLFDDVTVVHQNGTRFVTRSARVDAAHNTAEGDQPVEGHGPAGDVKAQGFRILDKGDRILFTGRSELWLKRAKPTAAAAVPPALPAPVARVAARTQAEVKPMLAASHRKTAVRAARRHVVRHPHPGKLRHAAHAKPAARKPS